MNVPTTNYLPPSFAPISRSSHQKHAKGPRRQHPKPQIFQTLVKPCLTTLKTEGKQKPVQIAQNHAKLYNMHCQETRGGVGR